MTKDEALKLALEALAWVEPCDSTQAMENAIDALCQAIEQAEKQEPVATVESVATVVSETGDESVTMSWWHEPALPVGTKLYTAPPQRTWVGLTDEERVEIWKNYNPLHGMSEFMRQIEAKLWNAALDEAAARIANVRGFGQATQDSFAVYIKGLKK